MIPDVCFVSCKCKKLKLMFYVVIALLVLLWLYRRAFLKKLPPGPWGLPVIGYLPFLNPKAPHETLTNLSKQYGKIYGVHLGNIYTVVLSDAAMISSAFSKDKVTGRAPLYVTHGIMGGYGLICAEGNMWRVHRKFTAKCLRLLGATKSSRSTTNLIPLIMREVQDCINSIDEEPIAIDPSRHLQHSVGSIMFQLVFGKSWSKSDPTWLWLQHLQEEGTKAIGVAGPLNFLPFLRFLPKYNKIMKFLLNGKNLTHKIYQKLIEDERKIFKTNGNDVPTNVIQAFLRELEITTDGKYFSNQQFYHLLADIFGAGLDTTLTTLRWYCLYMAAYPNVQDQIQDELDRVLESRLPTFEDLPLLPLMNASIAETQRIRSVVPVGIPHATLDDIELFGYQIPKGTMIIPLQWAIHMNSLTWSNPEEFNPKRFLNENMEFCKGKQFIPFQSGKRMCVGEDLAYMILFLFSSSILQKFRILKSSDEVDLEGEIGITLTPKEQNLCFELRLSNS